MTGKTLLLLRRSLALRLHGRRMRASLEHARLEASGADGAAAALSAARGISYVPLCTQVGVDQEKETPAEPGFLWTTPSRHVQVGECIN